MNMARSMLKEKHIPNEYWGEVVACVVYILNRSLTKSVKDRVPEESWNGKSFHISHLRIFGSSIHFHVSKYSRKKLDPTIELGVFVGYTETHNYQVYFTSLC